MAVGARIGDRRAAQRGAESDLFCGRIGTEPGTRLRLRACVRACESWGAQRKLGRKGRSLLFVRVPLRGCDAAGWVRPGNGKSAWVPRGRLSPAPRNTRDAIRLLAFRGDSCFAHQPISGGVTERRSSWPDRRRRPLLVPAKLATSATLSPCASGCPQHAHRARVPIPSVWRTRSASGIPNGAGAAGGSLRDRVTSLPGENRRRPPVRAAASRTMSLDSHTRRDRTSRRLRAEFPTDGDRWSPQLGVKTGAA